MLVLEKYVKDISADILKLINKYQIKLFNNTYDKNTKTYTIIIHFDNIKDENECYDDIRFQTF